MGITVNSIVMEKRTVRDALKIAFAQNWDFRRVVTYASAELDTVRVQFNLDFYCPADVAKQVLAEVLAEEAKKE